MMVSLLAHICVPRPERINEGQYKRHHSRVFTRQWKPLFWEKNAIHSHNNSQWGNCNSEYDHKTRITVWAFVVDKTVYPLPCLVHYVDILCSRDSAILKKNRWIKLSVRHVMRWKSTGKDCFNLESLRTSDYKTTWLRDMVHQTSVAPLTNMDK